MVGSFVSILCHPILSFLTRVVVEQMHESSLVNFLITLKVNHSDGENVTVNVNHSPLNKFDF